MAKVRFDDSLPALAAVIERHLGPRALEEGAILRDVAGRLSFFAPAGTDPAACEAAAAELVDRLGSYARTDRMVVQAEDFGAELILGDDSAIIFGVALEGRRVGLRLVDRRIVGADWLRKPGELSPSPPRFVFASLKGGVGRSTAAVVAACHLAGLGRKVLAIDLDLEAPGLGSLMLGRDALPEFGMIDALVENGISGLDEDFCRDLIGSSPLARGGGRIDVVPAIGSRSLRHPADVLAKLARAYVEDLRSDGQPATLLDQVREVVEKLVAPERYDVVLIDARAGLHESTATAFLGLGAEIFLFGIDEPQTLLGLELLLSHLARLAGDGQRLAWAERLTLVQAKAPLDGNQRAEFARSLQNLVTTADAAEGLNYGQAVFRPVHEDLLEWDDLLPDAEVLPEEWNLPETLAVLNNPVFHAFDPGRRRDLLEDEVYRNTFGELLDRLVAAVENTGGRA